MGMMKHLDVGPDSITHCCSLILTLPAITRSTPRALDPDCDLTIDIYGNNIVPSHLEAHGRWSELRSKLEAQRESPVPATFPLLDLDQTITGDDGKYAGRWQCFFEAKAEDLYLCWLGAFGASSASHLST